MSIHWRPVRCTGSFRAGVHGAASYPRAYTSILCAAHVRISNGPMGEQGPLERTPSTSINWHPVRCCTGRNRPCVHGGSPHPRASTSILRAAGAGIARGSMGEHPIHEHPRAPCALHRQESLVSPWGGTTSPSRHEHPARCTGSFRLGLHLGARHPRACTGILCAAQVAIAHGEHMGRHPIHDHPRSYCALHR